MADPKPGSTVAMALAPHLDVLRNEMRRTEEEMRRAAELMKLIGERLLREEPVHG